MKQFCLDAEWNPEDNDSLHVISISQFPTGPKYSFTDFDDFKMFVEHTDIDRWYIHSGMSADVPVINKHYGKQVINPDLVFDTFVISRLIDFSKYSTHSLKELGEKLGVYKGDYEGGWDKCTPEMIEYCEQDVEVLKAIVRSQRHVIDDPSWQQAIRTECDIAYVCGEMNQNGFTFDLDKAVDLLYNVQEDMKELEDKFRKAFPPKLVEVKRLKLRYTKDHKLYKNIVDALSTYPESKFTEDEVILYDYKEFNPGSPKERIDVLWAAGWEPYDKTKGHVKYERERKTKWMK